MSLSGVFSDADGNQLTITAASSDETRATVSAAIADATIAHEGGTHTVSLSGVFDDADNDSLTVTAASSDEATATASVSSDVSSLTVNAQARGAVTITVTAQDADGNAVSDRFDVNVVGPPTPVSNLGCVAQTGRVLFSWDVPEWFGAQVYAYDLTRPDGKREQARLFGYPAVSAKGEYQAGQEASISVKAMYELADGSEVYSEAATLTCAVAE